MSVSVSVCVCVCVCTHTPVFLQLLSSSPAVDRADSDSDSDSSVGYFLSEERVALSKEKSDGRRLARWRPLASEEEVVRLVNSWPPEEGFIGRLWLRTSEEVQQLAALAAYKPKLEMN